jgi:hypothetical protein
MLSPAFSVADRLLSKSVTVIPSAVIFSAACPSNSA